MNHRPSLSNLLPSFLLLGAAAASAGCGASAEDPGGDDASIASSTDALQLPNEEFEIDPNVPSNIPNEHCRMPAAMLNDFGVGRQVRLLRGPASTGHLSLCTVDAVASSSSRVQMNSDTYEDRLGTSTSPINVNIVSNSYDHDASNTKGVARPQAGSSPSTSFSQDVQEWSRDVNGQGQVLYTVPHGRIELGTVEQVKDQIIDVLNINDPDYARNAFWVAMYHTAASGGSFNHFHITSTDIHEESFRGLLPLMQKGFPYAVSFHGFAKDSPADPDVFVGGGETPEFREGVAETIEDELFFANLGSPFIVTSSNIPPEFAGTSIHNFVNELATDGQGLQIEQSNALRADEDARNAVARGVKSVYDCLLDGPDVAVTISSSGTYSANSGGTSYASANACPRWVYQANITGSGPVTLQAGVQQCDPDMRQYVDFYKQNADGSWGRIGGARAVPVAVVGQGCTWFSGGQAGLPSMQTSAPGVFRVVVGAAKKNAFGVRIPASPTATITL